MFGHRPNSVSAEEGARAADDGRVVIYWAMTGLEMMGRARDG